MMPFPAALLLHAAVVGGGGGDGPPAVWAGTGNMVESTVSVDAVWPPHQAGDIGVLFIKTDNADPPATPTGCTAIYTPAGIGTSNSSSGASVKLHAYWIRATSGAMPNITTGDSGTQNIARILVFRGCKASGNPIDVTATDTASTSTSVTIPGLTTTGVNRLVVAACGIALPDATNYLNASSWANSDLTDLVEITDQSSAQGPGGGFVAAAGYKPTAGAVGSTTATLANTAVQERVAFALIPADDATISLPSWSGAPGMQLQGALIDNQSLAIPYIYPVFPGGSGLDDIAFLQVNYTDALGAASAISVPADWTQIYEGTYAGATTRRTGLWWKRLDGKSKGAVTVSFSNTANAGSHLSAKITVWRGCVQTGTPYEGYSSANAQSANMAGNAVTTTGSDRKVVHFCVCDDDTTATEASGWTEEYEDLSGSGTSDGSLKAYSKTRASAGTEAAATHTLASTERWFAAALALIPR